jgi:hypothetical protein
VFVVLLFRAIALAGNVIIDRQQVHTAGMSATRLEQLVATQHEATSCSADSNG